MKNKLTLFLILFITFNSLSAQEYIIKVLKTDSRKYTYLIINSENRINSGYFNCLDFSKYGSAIVISDLDGNYQIINKKGDNINLEVPLNPVIEQWSGIPFGFSYGMVRTKFLNDFGALNYQGKLTVPARYDHLTEFNGHHAIGMKGSVYFIVNNKGEETKLDFNKVKAVKRFSEGLAPINIEGVFGYIDTLGQIVIKPKYKSVGHFNGGVAWAKNIDGRVGYIDKSGLWLVEPIFLRGYDYDQQSAYARVKSTRGWGYIDTANQFNRLGVTRDFFNFHDGLAINKEKGKFGFIDRTGSWVIKPEFDLVHQFKNGFARVQISDKWGLIDKKGEWLVEPKHEEIGNAVLINE